MVVIGSAQAVHHITDNRRTELAVDIDFSKLVFNHCHAAPVLLLEDVVEERGLAGTQKPGDYGDGHLLGAMITLVDVCMASQRRMQGQLRCKRFQLAKDSHNLLHPAVVPLNAQVAASRL